MKRKHLRLQYALNCESSARAMDAGVIGHGDSLEPPVFPAKAGIHSANLRKCAVDGLDSHFRGNDRRSQTSCFWGLFQPFDNVEFS